MVSVIVVFPDMLVKALEIHPEVEVDEVETVIDVYERLSEENELFAERVYPEGIPNRNIGVIVDNVFITSDDYEEILTDGCEICFQMPIAGG